MISSVFVDRPRLAIVIAIVMTIAGALSLLRIPVAQFPDIVPPQVQVTANYPGASAAVVEATVAQTIEAQVIGVDKMIYMKSNSGNDGSYSLTVSFELGTNPDINTVNVNNRVQAATPKLPPEVQRSGVTVQKRSSAVLAFMQFYSDEGKQKPLFISNYVTINVLDTLSRTPGVGQAFLFGKLDYSMRIWFDTNRLTSLNLAPSDIITAIQQQNVQAPVGRIGARPTLADQQFQMNVQTQGRLVTPEQFGDIVLRANPDGSLLRVKDVARVELGAANMDSESRLNGNPAVSIGVYLAPGANAVQTSQRVQQALDTLSKRFPPGLHAAIFYDSSTFVSDTIHEVIKTLAEAFALVVIVVFLFLGNLRATIIPTVAVPVSLIGTFAVLLAFGFSANTISLLALVLAIGIVVDDAIVVVENVERVMEEEPDSDAGAGHQEGHESDHRADRRDLARAAVGVRADRLHTRHFGHAVQAVRGHDQRCDDHFGDQCADPLARALRRLPPPYRAEARRHGLRPARHRPCARWIRERRAPADPGLHPRDPAGRGVRRRRLGTGVPHADRVPARRGPGCVLRRRAVARRRLGLAHAGGRRAGRESRCGRCRRCGGCCRSSASRCSTAAISRTRPSWSSS